MEIQAVSIWKNGQVKTASDFYLKSIDDDFATSAVLYYELRSASSQDGDGNTVSGETLSSGNLSISGQDYIDWGADADVNLWIYNWSADQLGLTII
jgi:hypothetical protein